METKIIKICETGWLVDLADDPDNNLGTVLFIEIWSHRREIGTRLMVGDFAKVEIYQDMVELTTFFLTDHPQKVVISGINRFTNKRTWMIANTFADFILNDFRADPPCKPDIWGIDFRYDKY